MIPALAATAEHHTRRIAPLILERAIPLILASVIAAILVFSEVPPNLIIVQGEWAARLLELYALVSVALIIRPDIYLLHRIALPLGVAAWGGRGGGFLELVLDLGRYDLLAAVAERLLIVALVVYFHVNEVSRHGREGTLT